MRLSSILSISFLAVALLPAMALGQAQPPPTGTLLFTCNVGSFRFVNGTGKLDFDFKGTVLVSDLKGTVKTSGNIRQEYKGHGRQAYFGSGHLTLDGDFHSLQWFGQNMKGQWVGRGRALLYG